MPPALSFVLGVLSAAAALLLIAAWLASGYIVRRRKPDPPCPPNALGLPFEHVTFTSRDGIALGGWLTGEPGRRPTVVFCAGMFGSMDGDTDRVPDFVAAGFDVLQFDWRAHGISDGSRGTLGVRELDDLLGALDFLQARGVGHVGLMGFSMGGAVALRAAAQDKRVACVVCDGGYVGLDHALNSYLRGDTEIRVQPVTWLAMRLIALRLGGLDLSQASPLPTAGQIAPRPVLLVHGSDDPFVPLADQDAIFAALGEPKELWRVEGAGHREAHDLDPEAYTQRVIGFFKAHLAAGGPA